MGGGRDIFKTMIQEDNKRLLRYSKKIEKMKVYSYFLNTRFYIFREKWEYGANGYRMRLISKTRMSDGNDLILDEGEFEDGDYDSINYRIEELKNDRVFVERL